MNSIMTKIDIFSGFLGAGKTTLIKKLIKEAYAGEKVVLIENEFGEIGIDGGFMKDAGIQITEMNSGCICCSLVGDFGRALKKVLAEYAPDRIIIEPSGVGKLSDVIRAVQGIHADGAVLNGFTTVVDANKCKMYMKNFGEFFDDQIENAGCIVLSHTGTASEKKIEECVAMLKEHNTTATIVTTDWESLDGKTLLAAMERRNTIDAELARLAAETEEEHHHHDDDDDDECCCHHHHDEDEDEGEHHHHHDDDDDDDECCCHHHHDEDEDEEEHHHHHDDDDDDDHECCHHHDEDEGGEEHHHHHHHHHADEVFTSWGTETAKKFTTEELTAILNALGDAEKYGMILRAKGIVDSADGNWIHFDYVPGEPDVRHGSADVTGRLCVIGSKINETAIAELFGVSK